MVRGEFDSPTVKMESTSQSGDSKEYINKNIPLTAIIKEGEFKIGCCSGSTIVPKSDPLSLLSLARQLDVDIILWGGTHNVEAYTLEEKFFVNPGSCSGAFSTDWPIVGDHPKDNTDSGNVEKEVNNLSLDDKKDEDDTATNKTEEHDSDEKSNKEDTKENNDDNLQPENVSKPATAEDEANTVEETDIEISELEISGANVPSFCLLDIQGTTCILYIYMFIDGEVKVDKVTYTKPSDDE